MAKLLLASKDLLEFVSSHISELIDDSSGGVTFRVVLINLLLVLGEGLESECKFFFGAIVSSVSGNKFVIFLLVSRDRGEELGL